MHYGDGGIQEHSMGDIYPASIVVRASEGHGYCRAENLVTGEQYGVPRFFSFDSPGFYGRFETAHDLAERDVPKDVPYFPTKQEQKND